MSKNKDIVIEAKERVLKDEVADCYKWKGHKKLFSELVNEDIKQCHELVDEWKNLRACYQYIVNSERYKADQDKEKRERVNGLATSHRAVEEQKVKKRVKVVEPVKDKDEPISPQHHVPPGGAESKKPASYRAKSKKKISST